MAVKNYPPISTADAEESDPSSHLERTVRGAVFRGASILRQLSLAFLRGAAIVSAIAREAADLAVGGPPEGVQGGDRSFHVRGAAILGSVWLVGRLVGRLVGTKKKVQDKGMMGIRYYYLFCSCRCVILTLNRSFSMPMPKEKDARKGT